MAILPSLNGCLQQLARLIPRPWSSQSCCWAMMASAVAKVAPHDIDMVGQDEGTRQDRHPNAAHTGNVCVEECVKHEAKEKPSVVEDNKVLAELEKKLPTDELTDYATSTTEGVPDLQEAEREQEPPQTDDSVDDGEEEDDDDKEEEEDDYDEGEKEDDDKEEEEDDDDEGEEEDEVDEEGEEDKEATDTEGEDSLLRRRIFVIVQTSPMTVLTRTTPRAFPHS
eukprot:gene5516-biopygen19250